ncbi:porin [Methylomonas paludis]|uniref:Porin n=1 Tax=Methylomonas paludis TaxID=1173101 RepID=A0A975MRU1_9GAMM|nr:porin [Methylomonas paludis]
MVLMSATTAHADNWKDASGAFEASGYNINDLNFFKKNNLKLGGWVETSISANDNARHDGFNGPVTFQDRTSELQLNQLNMFLQKGVTASGDTFDWGGRFDIMFGSDSIFTQAYGNPTYNPNTGAAEPRGNWDLKLSGDRFYGFAMPNAYAEFNLPMGEGLNIKAGHFYTPVGYEVVTAPDNFFVTKPYTFQYGEPFTHTGLLGSYTFNPNWNVTAGALTGSSTGGWDGSFNRNLATWSGLLGGTWTSDDAGTSLYISGTAGPQSDNNSSFWGIFSIVGKHNITDKLHLILQHDHGYANNVITGNGLNAVAAGSTTSALQNAEWYGLNSYLLYDVTDKLGAGLRAEWFRDNNGWRIDGPGRCGAAANTNGYGASATNYNYACNSSAFGAYPFAGSGYYELTAGLVYKPIKWLNLRPNVRFDYANAAQFAGGKEHTQVLFTADAVVIF